VVAIDISKRRHEVMIGERGGNQPQKLHEPFYQPPQSVSSRRQYAVYTALQCNNRLLLGLKVCDLFTDEECFNFFKAAGYGTD
jgi:hypothetical protein